MSLSYKQSCVRTDYVGDISTPLVIPPTSSLAFGTKMSEKHTSTSASAMEVKNWQKTINTAGKLDVISQPEKGERIFDIGHNVKLAYVQFVIMPIEL
jgi:hypothetical protein